MKKSKLYSLFFLLILAALPLTTSCSTTGRIYPEDNPELGWYPAKIETELTGTDPIEPFNRTMFTVNDFLMEWIADPVSRVYGSIMPRPGVEAIERVCLNLEFPARLISTLGSAEWKGALDETCRFLINTTVGIAGIFDPAEHWLQIHSTDSDFGQMFAVWGIGPGCTFILPFCPGTNVRDTVGFFFDYAFDIKSYLPYTYLATLNRFVVRQQAYAPVVESSADRYKTFRFMMALYREMQLRRWMYAKKNSLTEEKKKLLDEEGNLLPDPPLPAAFAKPAEKPAWLTGNWISQPEYFASGSGEQDTMRGIFTAPVKSNDYWWLPHTLWGSNFYREIDIRKMGNGGRYAVFLQPDPEDDDTTGNAPLSILVSARYPGAGTKEIEDTVAALIEPEMNGVENLLYFSSACGKNGTYQLELTFKPGTDTDIAMKHVQNALHRAEPALPQEVRTLGVNVKKLSGDTHKNDKLLIFIPGIEGTYDGTSTLMAAETFYEKGYDVITIDSVFFWRGMTEGAGKNNLPGYVPQDAQRIREYLAEVLDDVKKSERREYKDAILAGWSYGALCTAHIMQSEVNAAKGERKLPQVGRAVLINPPADLDYTMKTVDRNLRKTAAWDKEEMRDILVDTVGNALVSGSVHCPAIPEDAATKNDEIKMVFTLPRIRQDAAAAVSSIVMRGGIRDVLYKQHLAGNLPQLKNNTDWVNRNSLYHELERIEFQEYAQKFLMPALALTWSTPPDYELLTKASGLYPLMPFLKKAENITLIHTWNDILINDADRKALDQTFGKRGYWFDAGGHLGNLHTQRFRNVLLEAAGVNEQ